MVCYVKNEWNMAFLQLITDTGELEAILYERPSAFALLTVIAKRAKRSNKEHSELKMCEAMIGDWVAYGKKNTRQSYREDLKYLTKNGYITITRTTKKGTIVKLVNQRLFNINPEVEGEETAPNYNHQNNHQKRKSATINTTISKAKKNQTKKTVFVAPYNHQNNHQKTEITTISATTNNKLSRNILTAENAAVANFQNVQAVSEYIKSRCAPRNDGLPFQIYYDWQEKAVRYAKALRIDLEASFTKDNEKCDIAGSWFKIFKECADNKNGKAARIDQAFSLFHDKKNWDKITNEQRFKNILTVYHHGVEYYQTKFGYKQIE